MDWRLCDLNGRTLAEVQDLPGSQLTMGLSDKRSGTISVSYDDPAAAKIEPLRTVMKVTWNDQCHFAGVTLRPSYRGRDRKVSVPVIDPSIRLIAAFIGQRSDAGGLPGGDWDNFWRWTQLDQGEMLARLVDHARPTAAELARGVPDHGIRRGTIPPSVKRDREYEAGKQVWDAMVQLAHVIDGPDFDLDPVDEMGGVLANLNVYFPYMGTDRRDTVIFNYGWGSENLADYTWERGGDLLKNRSTQVGQKDATTGVAPIATRDGLDSQNLYGLYSEYRGQSDVVIQQTLDDDALASIINYGVPPNFIELRPSLDDGTGWQRDAAGVLRKVSGRFAVAPRFGKGADYYLGDIVRVVIKDGFVDLDLSVRVVGATMTRTSAGSVLVEPKVSPIIAGAYRVGGVEPPTLKRELDYLRQRARLVEVIQ